MSPGADRDRDAAGRARNARGRDLLGRPLQRGAGDQPPAEEVALPPADALRRAQALLDEGRPFEAHEVLEAVWKTTLGAERALWRGLAQVAVGITHALRSNEAGARSLLERGAETLAPYAGATPYSVDVDGVRSWALAASSNLTRVRQAPDLLTKAM
jgi:hypothetical protein